MVRYIAPYCSALLAESPKLKNPGFVPGFFDAQAKVVPQKNPAIPACARTSFMSGANKNPCLTAGAI